MSIQEIAEDVVRLNNEGDHKEVYAKYYTSESVSVEPMDGPMKVSTGLAAITAKMQWWEENNEVHGTKASGPLVADNHFAVTFWMDTTYKTTGVRTQMTELAVYQVKDGKIIREEFFYTM